MLIQCLKSIRKMGAVPILLHETYTTENAHPIFFSSWDGASQYSDMSWCLSGITPGMIADNGVSGIQIDNEGPCEYGPCTDAGIIIPKGDVNGDGVVDIRDIQTCINAGEVDVQKLREIINIILGDE